MISVGSVHPENIDFNGFCQWPHNIVTLPAPREHGGAAASCEDFYQSNVREFIRDIKKRDHNLMLAGQMETVVIADFVENIPDSSGLRGELWQAIREAQRLVFIVVVKEPAMVPELLPVDWGEVGYANFCLVMETCASPDRNREIIAAFKAIPARFRALWIDDQSQLDGIENFTAGVHWLIVDTCNQAAAGALTQEIIKWVNDFRDFGKHTGIPVFHNPPGCSGASIFETESMPPEHPFPADLDLHRPPLITNPDISNELGEFTVPTDVEIPHPSSFVEASEATVLQHVETEHLSSADPSTEVENLGPVSVAETDAELQDAISSLQISTEVTSEKRARFVELDQIARKGLNAFIIAGKAMMEIQDAELWREGDHASWDAYCFSVLGISKSYANRIIKSSQIVHEIRLANVPKNGEGQPILPVSESQARPLVKLESKRQRVKAWKISVKRAEGVPTAAIVTEVVCELMAKESPTKPPEPSRKERRHKLIFELCEAAAAEASWESVRTIAANLKQLI